MRFRLRAVLLFALMCLTHASFAQNLLNNPDVTTDSAGWSGSASTATSSTFWDNSRGYPTPGSLAINANAPEEMNPSFSQCVNISAQNVDLLAWTQLRYAGGPDFTILISYSAFSAPNCSSGYIQFRDASPSGTITNGWREYRLMNDALPAQTQSVRVFLILGSTGNSTGINVDNIAFGPAGTVVPSETVFSDGFE